MNLAPQAGSASNGSGIRGCLGTIPPVAERAAVERNLEEIGTQLAWVRDYL
jgi:hypothetical protein